MKLIWLILFLLLTVLAKSQRRTIDSLVNVLPSLKDSGRVDCLNKLSLEYYINALPETYINVQTDTAVTFASQAYAEAERINYTRGIADALQNLGEIARDRNDYVTAEKYFHQSVPLFEKLHEAERYSWANLTLGWSLHQQWKFSEAKSAYEKGMPFCIAAGNKERESTFLRLISYTYSSRGYNEKAFEYMLKAIRITYMIHDARGVISSPQNMASIYKSAGDKATALSYFRLAAQNAKPINPVRYYKLLGDICILFNQEDSATYYYDKANNFVTLMTTDTSIRKRLISNRHVGIGEFYLRQKKYALAIENFKHPFQFFEKGNDKTTVVRILSGLAKCYQMQRNFTESFLFAKRVLQMALETGARPFERNAYELYWKIYEGQGKTDSAYKYSLKYTALKDSIMSDEYRRNIAVSEMKSQDEQQKEKINLLQKEQQLSKEKLSLQQKEIRNESLLRNVLAGSIIFFILATVIIFRHIILRRKNEKRRLEQELQLQQLQVEKNKIEFQQQAAELEMQALRAQMNPHFIFNCLNSINRFIINNDAAKAADHLTKFAKLIRSVLEQSCKPFVPLEDEISCLKLYMDLEALRFEKPFHYKIDLNGTDVSTIMIPTMLIQPFVENAVWHGLHAKQNGEGEININMHAHDNILHCKICDNGVGIGSSNEKIQVNKKSLGMQLTQQRLQLFNGNHDEQVKIKMEQLNDEDGQITGTCVSISIPFKND